MTSRLRSSAKEEPKQTSLLSSKSRTYLSSSGEPREKSNTEGSRKKVSRKESRAIKNDGFVEIRDTNGHGSPPAVYQDEDDELDPDILYRRSRDHFGSWNIDDIIGVKERKSRLDMFESDGGAAEGKRIANGKSRSRHKSPENWADKRLDSSDRNKLHGESRSFDSLERDRRKSNKNTKDKISGSKSTGKEIGRPIINPQYYNHEGDDEYRGKNSRALLKEIENFGPGKNRLGRNGSPQRTTGERRYAANVSPERENDKIRLLIDRFKSNDGEEPAVRKPQRRRSSSREKEKLEDSWQDRRAHQHRSRRNDDVDDEDDERRVGSGSRKWTESSEDKTQSHRSLERRNGSGADGGFRKRGDTYSVEHTVRQKPRDEDRDARELSSAKRRSYVYSGSPDGYDVQIQRYERALTGPRKDPEMGRKSEVKRRSSLKAKDEMNETHDRNGRHNRPLTPPEDNGQKFEDVRTDFNAKDWYESNKQFAVRYLQENSKLRSPVVEERNDVGSPVREPRETYFGDRRRNSLDDGPVFGQKHASSLRTDAVELQIERNRDSKVERKAVRNWKEIDRTNGRSEPISIKIGNVSDERSENERRTRRGVFALGDEEINGRNRRRHGDDSPKRTGDGRGNIRDKDWTSAATPGRKMWNYREGGAQITDVDEGQPCLKCGDACPGFLQHPWRKNCTSCKCPREAHDVCHEEWVSVRSRLGLKGDGASGSVACDPREMGLAWAPPGLPSHKVEEYFSMLPEVSVPRLGTPGERYRDRQLATQLPKQDLAKAYCRHLATEHYTSADDFMAARNEIALDIGTVQEINETGVNCASCNEGLKYGSLAVSAGKLGEHYHPACFQCVQCRELLVDLAYCVYNDAVYCERHYAERLKGRCAACDELIFSGEFTRAMNKDWHSGHFCCWQCDESLTGQRYVLRDEHPYCIKCYESVFANGCEECSKIIGIDSKDLSYKDKHWHEACFLCNKCRVSLVDKQFGSKVDKIYCGNCYDAQFASRCDGCGEIFRAGTKKMEYKTRQWHEKCFCCVVCKNPIGTKSFIPREQEIYCAGCYEDKFATRCVKCNKIITSGGVTYKNEPWHRECFTCSNCSTSLAGQRFTSRDEKPYCADCFGELFAKRCTACTKPITGIGGTRFISFEDRHWHNDCFICAGCKTSLVGRGFITDADDIICPECAKQKLM